MHTLRGALTRAEYTDNHGIASLSLTLRQPELAGRYTSQTIEVLMSYGSGNAAHAAAQTAAASMILGGLYRINGRGLCAAGSQVWLLGAEEWALIAPPADTAEPAGPLTFAHMRAQLLRSAHTLESAC